jgi:hypothetical protein
MGPYTEIVNHYRQQLRDSPDRFRTMTELLTVVDFSTLPDREKLNHAWYIHLAAREILDGRDPGDNIYYA